MRMSNEQALSIICGNTNVQEFLAQPISKIFDSLLSRCEEFSYCQGQSYFKMKGEEEEIFTHIDLYNGEFTLRLEYNHFEVEKITLKEVGETIHRGSRIHRAFQNAWRKDNSISFRSWLETPGLK